MTSTILNTLRAIVIFEIVVTFSFSLASLVFYVKRLLATRGRIDTHLTWHVVVIAMVFLAVSVECFEWVLSRFSEPDFNSRMMRFFLYFGASAVAQYLLFSRQIDQYRQGK